MGSFKVKLVVYFLLLSLLPIAAAFWGFTAGGGAERDAPGRRAPPVRAARAARRLPGAARRGSAARRPSLARIRAFQRELAAPRPLGARAACSATRRTSRSPASTASASGRPPVFAATRQVDRRLAHGLVGYRHASRCRSTRRSSSALRAARGLGAGRRARDPARRPDRRLVAGGRGTRRRAVRADEDDLGRRTTATASLVAPAVADDPAVRFAVLSPQSLIDAANSSSRNQLLLGLIASLALVALVAYFEGRSIVRTLRSLAEAAHGIARGRLNERVPVRGRDEFALLGDRVQRDGEPARRRGSPSSRPSAAGCATRSPASARRSPRRTTSTSCCA